jgi:subtilase-type serine protease
MESAVSLPKRLRKTRLAEVIPIVVGCLATPYAAAQLTPGPAPISSYAGDPGTAGNTASWRTAEFLRDWGMRAVGADDAYAQGYAGQGSNIGVIDSGYFLGHVTEHAANPAGASGTRFYSVDTTGGTTGPTPGFYNQAFNDTHGTHVSGTVGASRDGRTSGGTPTVSGNNMHGVAFGADLYNGNTHKTDGVLYGLLPANANAASTPDNAYIGNIYRAANVVPTANGKPVRVITSSWGSQPGTENYNTYETPPPPATQTFGLKKAWMFLSTPPGVPDANGKTDHWLWGAIEVARTGTIIQFTAGNGGYANTTPRGSATYFMPELEGRWYTTSAITTTGQTFNADGSILVPGQQTFNQCGVAKWGCVTAPGSAINSTTVTVSGGVPTATYGSASGTSMAGPHSAAVLTLIMQRFPYMTNEQALYTMYTTSRQNNTINNAAGTAITNPERGLMVKVPDNRNGWGTVNLKDAFKGPSQLLGRFIVNTQGYNDVWSNDITNLAMNARKAEDDAEAAAWAATKTARGWNNGFPGGDANDLADYQIGNRSGSRPQRTGLPEQFHEGRRRESFSERKRKQSRRNVGRGRQALHQWQPREQRWGQWRNAGWHRHDRGVVGGCVGHAVAWRRTGRCLEHPELHGAAGQCAACGCREDGCERLLRGNDPQPVRLHAAQRHRPGVCRRHAVRRHRGSIAGRNGDHDHPQQRNSRGRLQGPA